MKNLVYGYGLHAAVVAARGETVVENIHTGAACQVGVKGFPPTADGPEEGRRLRRNIYPHRREAAGVAAARHPERKALPTKCEDLLKPSPFSNAGICRDAIAKRMFDQSRYEAIARDEPFARLEPTR